MRAKDLRVEVRVPVNQRGTVSAGDTWFPCLIMDMSEKGILLMSNRNISVGQHLDFRCELFPDKVLECKLEVVHGGEDGLGTRIVDIDAKGSDLYRLFLQEQYSDKLDTSR